MKRKLLGLIAIALSAFIYAEEKHVIIFNEDEEHGTITRGPVSNDYLQVVNDELYVYSVHNVSGTCHYTVYDNGTVVLDANVALAAFGSSMIPVKSLPVGEYIIEVVTPSSEIRKVLVISTDGTEKSVY